MEKFSLSLFRHSLGLTQKELADRVGVSRNYIALVERGSKPLSLKLKEKLSQLSQNTYTPPSEGRKLLHLINEATGTTVDPVSSTQLPWKCPDCAKKDLEIVRLNRVVENLASALAVKHN